MRAAADDFSLKVRNERAMIARSQARRPDEAPVEAGREEALARLNAVDLPVALPFKPEEWPIAGAMLQFPGVTGRGASVRAAGPERWRSDLSLVAAEGFRAVELPSAWLPFGEMSAPELDDLKAVLREVNLDLCATAIVRRSFVDRGEGLANLAATHRAIEATAALGSPLICLSLHGPLRPEQRRVAWFWTVTGETSAEAHVAWDEAVARSRELADHARDVGVQVSFELYEGTYLGTADSAIRFLAEIDRDNVGLNPDLGNLIRVQQPIEPWESMAVKTLPFANYWHVKNYARAEDPNAGIYLTSPASLAAGLIDYRRAIAFAVASGFRGPFLCENYGGDGLSVSAENMRYLSRLLGHIGLRETEGRR
jgi:sugar phosphate isomerase/epimerase